jgi:hypothetical protein
MGMMPGGMPGGMAGMGMPMPGMEHHGQRQPNLFANLLQGFGPMPQVGLGPMQHMPPPQMPGMGMGAPMPHPMQQQFAPGPAMAPPQPHAEYLHAGYLPPHAPAGAPVYPGGYQGPPQQQFSYVPQQPAASYAPPIQQAPSYAPAPVRVVQHVPQHQPASQPMQQQAPQSVERILVTINGREGVNDVINGAFQSIGEHGGRYSFSKSTNEGPIYLYYDQASDNWCIGDQIGSQSYYAVCGPSNGQDMAQQWRIWTGDEWEVDPKMTATIH